jgi:fibronectin-binding autotransporter adhesin
MKTKHNVQTLLRAGALLAVAVTVGNLAQAQTCSATWTGNEGNGQWNTAGNWSPRKVPGPTSNVCIPLLTTANATPPISIHSLQISQGGLLIIESGKAGASFSVATSLNNQGGIELYGAALSAGSIEMTDPSNFGSILAYSSSNPNTSSITSPAFSNTTGTVYVGAGVTLRLTDNPVQLQNGTLSGGNWEVDDLGVLIVPSDISQITGGPGGAYYTVLSVTSGGSLQDTSGNNPLATLASVDSYAVLEVPSLALDDLTCQGLINVGSLTISGTLTLASGCTAGAGSLTVSGTLTVPSGATAVTGSLLSATSVIVESGGTLSPGGTVQSSITNNGTVSPGIATVMGNYSQAAGAALTEQFGNYSTLNVKQNATLSGALNVEVNPKHPPASGAKYTALTAGSLSGSFTSHTAGFTLTTSATGVLVTKQ